MKPSTKKFASSLFGKSEIQNRIAINAVKMIIGDIVTLYKEFRKAKGLGALFFNPVSPENSTYLDIEDIKNDMILAEEIMDDELKQTLQKLLNVIDKEQDTTNAVVVLLDSSALSIHLVDLNTTEEVINEVADAVIRD